MLKRRSLVIGASLITIGYLGLKFVTIQYQIRSLNFVPTLTMLTHRQFKEFTKNEMLHSKLSVDNLIKDNDRIQYSIDLFRNKEVKESFAQLLVKLVESEKIRMFKIEDKYWRIDSLDINFRNDSNWLRLCDFYFNDEVKCDLSNEKVNEIIKSNLFRGSEVNLNDLNEKHPYAIKVLEIISSTRDKPIRIISFDAQQIITDAIFVSILVEENNKKYELHCNFKKTPDSWTLVSIRIMHDIDENLFPKDDLSVISTINPFKQEPVMQNFEKIFDQIKLNRIIDLKINKNSHTLSVLGEPIEFENEIEEISDSSAKVKVNVYGRLNNAELIINITRDEQTNTWKVLDSKMKILWK